NNQSNDSNQNQNHSQSQSKENNNQAVTSNSKDKVEYKQRKEEEEKNNKQEKNNKEEKSQKAKSSSKNEKNDKKKEKKYSGNNMVIKREESAKVVKLKLSKPVPSTPPGAPHHTHGLKNESVATTVKGQDEKEIKNNIETKEKNTAKKNNMESQSSKKTKSFAGDLYSEENIVGTSSYTGWPMTNSKKFVN
ncbi:hypothetical protein V7083_12775, partial [Bacillus sp. JJ1764]